jgi:hypothetical protein
VIQARHCTDPEIAMLIFMHVIDPVIANAIFTFLVNISFECSCLFIENPQSSTVGTYPEIVVAIFSH